MKELRPLVAVPSLADVLADRMLVGRLPRAAAIAYRREILHLLADLEARVDECAPVAAAETTSDEPLGVDEAARRLGIARGTLYRNARTTYADLLVQTGTRKLVFSARAIQDYQRLIPRRT